MASRILTVFAHPDDDAFVEKDRLAKDAAGCEVFLFVRGTRGGGLWRRS